MTDVQIPQSTVSARSLGGTASNFTSPNGVAYGLMGLTWSHGENVPDEIAFACMKEAIQAGSLVWSSATFYGVGENYIDNIKLMRRFFEAHPQYKDKVFITVKGGFSPSNNLPNPDSSEESLRADLEILHEHLPPSVKRVDAYGPARVDKKRPIEDTMATLVKLQSEGLFDHIFLSETGAETLQRACTAFPGKVVANEVEYNPFSLEVESGGVLEVAKKNDVAIFAYSPFSRGILTGSIKSLDDIPQGDMRRRMERYSPENFPKNLEVANDIQALAKKNSTPISPTQLTLAWLMAQYEKVLPLAGSVAPQRTKQNCEGGNVKVDPELLKEYRAKVDALSKQVQGHRYMKAIDATLMQ